MWQKIRNGALVLAAAGLFGGVTTGGALAASYSSIVLDAESGRILIQHDPDRVNYPASLTKMMTLYLTFSGLEHGKLTLDRQFVVSQHASIQAPSKLDLRPGETIALRDLILGIVTKSANDAAVVVAEGIAGSESAFADRMTQQARQIGMLNTHFANASGLPNPDNTTTARDLSTLARALYRDFPKEYAYFATEEFSYRGNTYANHNHLMSAFQGMDGIKTGYIRASGFNLAASAVRDGHRLIAVVMGGESAHSRDMKMADLLTAGFERDRLPGNIEVAEDGPAPAPRGETLAHKAGRALAVFSPVGRAEAATHPASAARRDLQLSEVWSIQVGTFAQSAQAEKAAAQALAKLPAAKGRTVLIVAPGHSAKDKVFRARIVHFNAHEAQMACRVLHRTHRACAVIAPDATQLAAAK